VWTVSSSATWVSASSAVALLSRALPTTSSSCHCVAVFNASGELLKTPLCRDVAAINGGTIFAHARNRKCVVFTWRHHADATPPAVPRHSFEAMR
jgi:hypothetical protein